MGVGMAGVVEMFVIVTALLLRFWLLPKAFPEGMALIPRWLWILLLPVLMVSLQWSLYPAASPWVYSLGAGTGVALGILFCLAPQPPSGGTVGRSVSKV
jgi:hypothetical protein